jgi:hypothetical protein
LPANASAFRWALRPDWVMAILGRLLLGALLVVAACHDPAEPTPDGAPPPPPPELSCRELADQWRTLAAGVDRSCDGDADCAILGGHVGGFQSPASCNCVLWLAPVAAPSFPDAMPALLDTYADRCARDPDVIRICDAAQTTAACVDGTCRTETTSCLEPE